METLVFSTEGLQPSHRIDAWNAAFGSLNEIIVPDGRRPKVLCQNWLLGGGLVLSETSVRRAQFSRNTVRVRRDQLDHWVIRVIRRGHGHLRHKDFEVTTGPGDIVLIGVDETWVVDWHDVEWVSLCIPRDFDLRLTGHLEAMRRGRLHGLGANLLADFLLALPARVAGASTQELPQLTNIVRAAVLSCLAGSQQDGGDTAASELTLARARVRSVILREIRSTRLTPSRLAAASGMSRSALYRLYEAEGGVARHIRHTRLTLAHAALQDPDCAHKSIATIAEEHGFPDPPEFSRAFRTLFGVTPSDVRRLRPPLSDRPILEPAPLRSAFDLTSALYRVRYPAHARGQATRDA